MREMKQVLKHIPFSDPLVSFHRLLQLHHRRPHKANPLSVANLQRFPPSLIPWQSSDKYSEATLQNYYSKFRGINLR